MQRMAKRNSSRSMLPPPSASKNEKIVLYSEIRSLLTPYLLCSAIRLAALVRVRVRVRVMQRDQVGSLLRA